MQSEKIECKPTPWVKTRLAGMAILLLGFGVYFFYDAAIGYPKSNVAYFTHKAFESAGQAVDEAKSSEQWSAVAKTAKINFFGYPVPSSVDADATPWPDELMDYGKVKSGWHDAWLAYTARMKMPIKPAEHPFDAGKITEQNVAGGICIALVIACLFLLFRTLGRVMSIDGEKITASGTDFSVSDIKQLDLRKWKNKGIAHATLQNGSRVRLDGFCYGGFAKGGKNADDFLNALKAVYRGDIVDYAEEPETADEAGGDQKE